MYLELLGGVPVKKNTLYLFADKTAQVASSPLRAGRQAGDSFHGYSFNDFLDIVAAPSTAVGETLADLCQVAFLVQLPHVPIYPWPEVNQNKENQDF